MTQCFWLEPTGRVRKLAEVICREGHRVTVAERVGLENRDAEAGSSGRYAFVDFSWEDVEWPTSCPECAAPLAVTAAEDWESCSISGNTEYGRADTGQTGWGPMGFGPGAMWDAHWMSRKGQDGRCIVVILPNGHDWMIDSQSSNCTRKGEDHDCWCRHGEPPNLTVDKNPEPGRSTCKAGGGSIASGTHGEPDYWHGFLRGGLLVD